ncbi:hypothetical protein PF004_g27785 [Phytophthora fragariae]|uniref:Uncharacterized protein n=1 Tax=Phytophthora fragariae TaxID=53985 RepID=A0A6G0MKC4_9STRA|nr:hypothetical protein PF004_g27785 [Phytophthora fragariae]
MDLLDAIRQDVLKPKHEEPVNFFSKVYDFRQFIIATSPAAYVSVTVKMCCLSSERLRANNGTCVTVIDASQHGVFNSTQEALHDLRAGKRKAYIAQITVWNSKVKKGVANRPNLIFHPGALYEFRQIDGVGFFADILIGRVRFEADNVKIVELLPPSNKSKAAHGSCKKNAKGKTKAKEPTSSQDTEPGDEPEDDEPEDDGADGGDDDVSMDSETKMEEAVVAARTGSNSPPGGLRRAEVGAEELAYTHAMSTTLSRDEAATSRAEAREIQHLQNTKTSNRTDRSYGDIPYFKCKPLAGSSETCGASCEIRVTQTECIPQSIMGIW